MTFLQIINENEFINKIETVEIKNFTIKSLQMYGTEEKLNTATKTAKVLHDIYVKEKLVNQHVSQIYIELAYSAALLHNLFYSSCRLSTLFELREKLTSVKNEIGLHENGFLAICEMTEGQLGKDTPIEKCQPMSNTPTELFAWAVWIAKYIGDK